MIISHLKTKFDAKICLELSFSVEIWDGQGVVLSVPKVANQLFCPHLVHPSSSESHFFIWANLDTESTSVLSVHKWVH